MNVSSVKNLNGEALSSVQDASLTNVIQTNSGNWQDITAYQNASATYLTEVSIPESATWNEVSTTVQTNSAQWAEGGNTEVSHDNTLSGNGTVESPLGVVPGYNETVLFNTTNTSTINTLNYQLSESIYNFEKIGVFIKRTPVPMQIFDTNDISASNGLFNTNYISMSDAFSTNEMYFFTTPWSIGSNGTVISATNKSFGVTFDLINVKFNCYKNNGTGPLYKIVGINRKAQ